VVEQLDVGGDPLDESGFAPHYRSLSVNGCTCDTDSDDQICFSDASAEVMAGLVVRWVVIVPDKPAPQRGRYVVTVSKTSRAAAMAANAVLLWMLLRRLKIRGAWIATALWPRIPSTSESVCVGDGIEKRAVGTVFSCWHC